MSFNNITLIDNVGELRVVDVYATFDNTSNVMDEMDSRAVFVIDPESKTR